ncbi:MAG: hypothetical protein M3R10_06095 [Verrucomicrobiota bacterium]|nr:hypothetical protein [Verrucomicrobiota bacterium]
MSEELARRLSTETGIASDWLLANDLNSPPISVYRGHFTPADYIQTRANRENGFPSASEVAAQMLSDTKAIVFYAWLRAIFGGRHADIAVWKVGQFLEELAREHGSARHILAERELEPAKLRDWETLRRHVSIGLQLAQQHARQLSESERFLEGLMSARAPKAPAPARARKRPKMAR